MLSLLVCAEQHGDHGGGESGADAAGWSSTFGGQPQGCQGRRHPGRRRPTAKLASAPQAGARAGAHRLAVPSYPLAHQRRYAASVMNIILGGGMSSRLFQNIRERQGLAYAYSATFRPIPTRACFRCTRAPAARTVEKLMRLVAEEFRRIKEEPVSEEELRRAKEHLKGSLMLSLDRPGRACPTWRARDVSEAVFHAGRHADVAGSGDARGSAADRARVLQAGADCRDRSVLSMDSTCGGIWWLAKHSRSRSLATLGMTPSL